MEISIAKFILAVAVTQVITFVLSGLFYMNPVIAPIYKKFEDHPGMRRMASQGQWMRYMFSFTLIEVFFAGLLFFITAAALPGTGWMKGFYFGLLLAGVRVFGRFVFEYMLTSYPTKLMKFEILFGIIDCIVIGLCFTYFL